MYEIAKCAIVQLTRSLALSLAEDNVQANCIVPGFFDTTEWQAEAKAGPRVRKWDFFPMERAGGPEEMGRLAVFLASDASAYITGGLFVYDGAALAGGYAPTGYVPTISTKEE